MSIKDILSYILLMILIAFTLLNFYALLTSKKRRAASTMKYNTEMSTIESNLLRIMKERALNFTMVRRFMNDKGQGIILVADMEKRIAAIGMTGDTELFSFGELTDAHADFTKGKRRYHTASVTAVIRGVDITYEIGTRPFFRRGIIGKVIYETAGEFNASLWEIINASKDPAGEGGNAEEGKAD